MKEADIESALVDWLPSKGYEVIGRQVELPIGRLDVLAWHTESKRATVFEVKLGKAPDYVSAQLIGYCHFVENILIVKGIYNPALFGEVEYVSKYVVAESLSEMTSRLAHTHAIEFIKYSVKNGFIEFDEHEYNYEPYASIEQFETCGRLDRLIDLYNDSVKTASAADAMSKIFSCSSSGGCTDQLVFGSSLNKTAELWKAK